MPMFSNRQIALLIREVPDTFHADLIGRIAGGGSMAVAAEWELLVIYLLAKRNLLEVIPAATGQKRPDAIFVSSATGERAIIEITAISDDELNDRYPVGEFSQLFYRGLRKLQDQHLGSFDICCNGVISPSELLTVALPKRKHLNAFFQSPDVKRFLQTIATKQTDVHQFEYRQGDAITTVTFNPGARFSNTTGNVFQARTFNEPNKDKLVRRIRKKVSQINLSGLGLPSILVLCDNDCHMLRHHQVAAWTSEGVLNTISNHIQGRAKLSFGPLLVDDGFRQQTTAINSTIVLNVEERHNPMHRVIRQLTKHQICNSNVTKYSLSHQAIQEFYSIFESYPEFLCTPVNAKQLRKWPHNFGGYRMSNKKIRFSMLALQDLLLGKITHEVFAKNHADIVQQLQRWESNGNCIKSANIISSPMVDDDWIEFDVSAQDPRSLKNLISDPL